MFLIFPASTVRLGTKLSTQGAEIAALHGGASRSTRCTEEITARHGGAPRSTRCIEEITALHGGASRSPRCTEEFATPHGGAPRSTRCTEARRDPDREQLRTRAKTDTAAWRRSAGAEALCAYRPWRVRLRAGVGVHVWCAGIWFGSARMQQLNQSSCRALQLG